MHLSLAEAVKIGLVPQEKRRSKYLSVRTVVDSITFASQREARRYSELMLLQRAGVVFRFELQPEFTLQPGYRGKDGRWVRPIKYRADFRIWWASGTITVEDVKPTGYYRTETYRIKKKLLLAKYPGLNFVET